MGDAMKGAYWTIMGVLAAAVVFVLGQGFALKAVSKDCDTFGAVKINSTLYKCAADRESL